MVAAYLLKYQMANSEWEKDKLRNKENGPVALDLPAEPISKKIAKQRKHGRPTVSFEQVGNK